MWKDIKYAPKEIGRPVWVRGNNLGNPEYGQHYMWAYWDGERWLDQTRIELTYLTDYLHEK